VVCSQMAVCVVARLRCQCFLKERFTGHEALLLKISCPQFLVKLLPGRVFRVVQGCIIYLSA